MTTKLNFRKSIIAGLLAGVTALIINVVLFFIFHGAGIITDTIFIKPNLALNPVPVIVASFIPALIGGAVFFLFEKYTNNGFRIFTIFSIIILLLSFTQPFKAIPNVTTGYALALNLMHIVVVAALLYFINKSKKNNV